MLSGAIEGSSHRQIIATTLQNFPLSFIDPIVSLIVLYCPNEGIYSKKLRTKDSTYLSHWEWSKFLPLGIFPEIKIALKPGFLYGLARYKCEDNVIVSQRF